MKLVLLSHLLAVTTASMAEDFAFGSYHASTQKTNGSRRLGGSKQRGAQGTTDSVYGKRKASALRRGLNSKAAKQQSGGAAPAVPVALKSDKKGKDNKAKEPKPSPAKDESASFAEKVHENFEEAKKHEKSAKKGKGSLKADDSAEESPPDRTVEKVSKHHPKQPKPVASEPPTPAKTVHDSDDEVTSWPTYYPTYFPTGDMEDMLLSTSDSTVGIEEILPATTSTSSTGISSTSSVAPDDLATSTAAGGDDSSSGIKYNTPVAPEEESSTFATTPASSCPASCDSKFCECISHEVSTECIPLLADECSSQGQCLTDFFTDDTAVSVFCNSVSCLDSGKSETECRCQFMIELCDMEPDLGYQCDEASCCADADNDGDRGACFATPVAPTGWETTSTVVASTNSSNSSTSTSLPSGSSSTNASTTGVTTSSVAEDDTTNVTAVVAPPTTELPVSSTSSTGSISSTSSTSVWSSSTIASTTGAATSSTPDNELSTVGSSATVSTVPGEVTSDIAPCTIEFCEYSLSEELLLKYKLNAPEETISMELIYDDVAWLGFASSTDGQMVGSEAIIGIPGENGIAPQKYYLGGKDVSVVLPVEEDRQTLINASIEVVNGQTVMKFTKLMKEVDHIEILHGENTFLWAHGSDSTLGYHQSRSQFVLTL